MITVGIIEDDEHIRSGIQAYLNNQPNLSCEYGYQSMEAALADFKEWNVPSVLIIDLGLPGMSGIEGMKILKERYPECDLVVFSVFNDYKKIFDSLCAGATGYLLKNTPFDEIKEGIESLAKGGSPMSPQIARKSLIFLNLNKN